VVVAATTVLRSSYSREIERATDGYAVALVDKAGGDPRALARVLGRISSERGRRPGILLDHPDAQDRIAAINATRQDAPRPPLIDAEAWAAVTRICSGRS
jgi:predicted Zn-dependent protease